MLVGFAGTGRVLPLPSLGWYLAEGSARRLPLLPLSRNKS
jgi:hypothetical protein